MSRMTRGRCCCFLVLVAVPVFLYLKTDSRKNTTPRIKPPENDRTVGLRRSNSSLQTTSDLAASVSSNWTRPLTCNKCFNTEFPPLITNAVVCKTGSETDKVDVIMLVFTTRQAVDRRQAIRDTWASVTRNNTANVRHVFVLGHSGVADDIRAMREEQDVYGDIIAHDFVDSYRNLTLKTMSALRWAVKHCANARFFLKTDDDVWVNVPVLLNTLNREQDVLQTTLGGACTFTAKPHRHAESKWHVPFRSYPQSSYPGYCSGTGYVSSLAMARYITSVSPDVPFFHLEDVYVALCIQRLGGNFTVKRLGGFFHNVRASCTLKSRSTVTSHGKSAMELRRIWNTRCPHGHKH